MESDSDDANRRVNDVQPPADRLEALAQRLEQLVLEPARVRDRLGRLAAPVLRALKWEPAVRVEKARSLVERLRSLPEGDEAESLEELVDEAIEELEDNVSQLERACVVQGRAPTSHASWLWRLYQVIHRAHRTVDDRAAPGEFAGALWDEVALLPPLTVREPATGHLVQVDCVDPLLAAARDEKHTLERRRRLLEAARNLLLDSAAAMPLDAASVEARQAYIAQEIAYVNRLEAAGVAPNVALTHQAREAAARGDVQRVHATMVALDGIAVRRGDGRLHRLTQAALDRLWKDADRFTSANARFSLARSVAQTFDASIRDAVIRGLDRGRASLAELGRDARQAPLVEAGRAHLGTSAEDEMFLAALHVDGCFDVGGVLSPVRVVEEHRRVRQVAFPTQDMVLAPARRIEDIPAAIIEDPRTLLVSLAAGRLLARRFVLEETAQREKTALRSEVRVYVLDGSASMLGPRARMRDAILLAELATLIARFDDSRRTLNPVLYYRYFTKDAGTLHKVDSAPRALQAIEDVSSQFHTGGTDIQKALFASFRAIRSAQESDASLARAQIVLVTDGEAPVDEAALARVRQPLGALPVGVSIIALGQQNEALRALAARQRAAGEATFYQYVSDSELKAIIAGKKSGLPLHLPSDAPVDEVVTHVIDEIAALQRNRDAEELARSKDILPALDEVRLTLDAPVCDAERAELDALARDARTLERRFERWFPATASADTTRVLAAAGTELGDVERVAALLLSVAEVVTLLDAPALARRVDAIEILERLLMDAGIAPWRYAELLARYPHHLARPVAAVRSAAAARDDA